MSFLPSSRDTIIQDGQFTNAQTVNNYNFTGIADRDPWQILEGSIALDALFDSDARFDPPKCHPDTRTAVLDHIDRWATDLESPPVMWIRGAAGAGKSAISQTLSERWDDCDSLAATFYFSRTAAGRNEKRYLISTLAYQLSTNVPGTRHHIENAIRQTPKIFERNLRTQMKQLIINPLVALSKSGLTTVKLVVIDGLDECCIDYPNQDHEQQQKEILESIQLALGHKGFPLRFLIASRPERQIREIFDHGGLASIASRTVLDDTQNPTADIELYLQCKLDEIRKRHPYLGASWPPQDVITQLAAKSSGQFIYAAVVVRFLSSPRGNPDEGLKQVMGINTSPDSDSPFAELDALYTHILNSVAPQSLTMVMNIFGLMIYENIYAHTGWDLFKDAIKMSPLFIARYLFISLAELHRHLIDLHSLLDIPSGDNTAKSPVSFLHASFSEFLTQSSRSARFYINKEQRSLYLLSLSLRHLCVQSLLPLGGTTTEQYYRAGFAFQTSEALGRLEPDNNILEALQALLGKDENEFFQYIHREGLDVFGTTRQSIGIIRYLYNWKVEDAAINFGSTIDRSLPVALAVLEKHHFQNFLPLIDPLSYQKLASLSRPYCFNLGDWEDPGEEATNSSSTEPAVLDDTPSSPNSTTIVELEQVSSDSQDSSVPIELHSGVGGMSEDDACTPHALPVGQSDTCDLSTIITVPEETKPDSVRVPEHSPNDQEASTPGVQQEPEISVKTPTPKRRSGFRKRFTGFLAGSSGGKGKS